MAPRDIIILSHDQLRKLAKVMYYKGAQGIHTIKFSSNYERAQYLTSCRDAFLEASDLIDTTESAIEEFKDDPRVSPVVYAYADYVKGTLEFAHQSIKMYSQRAIFIKQLKKHASNVLKVLREHKINPLTDAKIAQLTEEITVLSNAMLKYVAEAARPAARKFSMVLRRQGFTFNRLLRRCQTKLGLKGRFKKLGIERQIQVFDKVVESTGGKLITYGKKTMQVLDKYGGKALYGMIAFTTAVDMYSADPDKRYEVAIQNVVTIGGSILFKELEVLILEAAFALVCTGQPILIAAGLALAVADFVAASVIQDFIEDTVAPVVVDFMNNYKDEVKQTLEIAAFNPTVALLEAVGVSNEKIPRLFRYRPGAFQLYSMMFDENLDEGPSFFLSPWLSLTPAGAIIDIFAGKSDDPVMDLIFSFPVLGLLKDIFESIFESAPSPKKKAPPPPISTYGITILGPGVPDGRVLAQQIASKA